MLHLHRVFPAAKSQICIFHLNTNIKLNLKKKWGKKANLDGYEATEGELNEEERGVVKALNSVAIEEDQQQVCTRYSSLPTEVEYSKAGLYQLCAHILYAPTKELFHQAYDLMQDIFKEQTAFLNYVEHTYMPIRAQWATCFTNKYLNFGQRTTSRVEGVNRELKAHVVTGNSTILQAVEKSFQMAEQMERRYKYWVKNQKKRMRGEYTTFKWLGETRTKICWRAQDFAVKQYRHMLRYLPDSPRNRGNPASEIPTLESSGSQFTGQCGILDYEALFKRIKETKGNLVLSKLDFDSYWWLDRSLDQDDHYLRIQEPDKVTSLRGRPAGSTALAPDPAAPRNLVSALPLSTAPARLPGRISGLNPSISRNRSQFEIEGINLDDNEAQPVIVVSAQASGGPSGAKATHEAKMRMTKPAGQSGTRKRAPTKDAAELAATSRSGRKLKRSWKAAEEAGDC